MARSPLAGVRTYPDFVAAFDASVLRQPRWILAIIVGLLFAVAFVRLGFWQLDRLDQRRTANALVEERRDQEPRQLVSLVTQYGLGADALDHRPVTVEGTYRSDLEVISIGRTYGEVSGTMVVTPLELADGSLLMVVRGIVPTGTPGPPVEGYEVPSGRVVLEGRLDGGEEPLRLGEPDPADGKVKSISRIDLSYLDRWIAEDVLPVSLVLEAQVPPDPNGSPAPVPPDELTEGPHLGYAVQWFAFAVIVVGGVGGLIWRAGKDVEDDETEPDPIPLR